MGGLPFHVIRVSSYGGDRVPRHAPQIIGEWPDGVTGRRVLVLDDILDTGHTLAMVQDALYARGAAQVDICVLLSKRRTRPAGVNARFVGFEIDDVFVVGYGLDFDGRLRDLPFVGILAPPDDAGGAGEG
jgi:hypoxanthine phosphoribosyltransferase